MTKDNFIMLPTVDFCFKELMQNAKVRKGFIAALLKVHPEDIRETALLPTLLPKESADDKLGIMDVRILLMDVTQMNLEMQVKYFEYWDERVLFYLSKMFASQIKKGESYDKLQKCIHVSILDFIHFPDDDECYRCIHLCDDKTHRIYSDKMELQILELKKLPPEVKTGEDIIAWMKFFSGKKREEFERMAKTNEYLDEAYQTLLNLSADEQKRLEYEAREKALKDYNTQISSAEKRGRKAGEEIGQKIGLKMGEQMGEQRARQVFKLYMQGKTPEEIAALCNLTIDKVNEILK
ncbi:MAG: Rpn family recombination-promoting nuclease/putative transposase [Faecalicatena sp.]|uniref:Rpn family recombination-promoting nuclease/putative transposase n=1 Tax=Faecalicatena sp. TaxID=2005360 RepID=UPI002585D7B9|nr:Rpn family recombination-promoting nuclease/putative transposase [Faecalicatena sp.]MCI6467863.1 Rpn family recombination-promoting nuclease/putative transposase [Faecalicatena sp.]MDY5619496.1 Rpn family recombination-promoting nuclease/putative transposase [Lachnospiraceae bacterium]